MPTVRVAAISDVHCTKSSQGTLQPFFTKVAEQADAIVMCGDLTDYGLPEEARVLARELSGVRTPIVGVRGNHDFESGQEQEVRSILADAGLMLLDGESYETHGVGFAGTKGFAGGFGRSTLGAWGEPAIKEFVHEAMQEALKLESALARLRTRQRVAVLHYAPVRSTVEGEPVDIFPWLGCSRLEEPLSRYPVTAVFHGHAHNGTIEGHTTSGIPVFNVAMPLLKKHRPGELAAQFIDIDPAAAPVNGEGTYSGPDRRRG